VPPRTAVGAPSGCAGAAGRVARATGAGARGVVPRGGGRSGPPVLLGRVYGGMIGPRSGPRGGGTRRPRTVRSCNQLGSLVLLAGLPRQLPGDDEVEPGADGDRRCLVAAQWMDVRARTSSFLSRFS